tara:strand:+ start:163 stop:366 length:204 start_codon:yes stop_codon:yes gene_type:complete
MNPKITLFLTSPKNKLGVKDDVQSGVDMAKKLVSHLRENQFKVMTDEQIDAFVNVLIKEFDIKNRLL